MATGCIDLDGDISSMYFRGDISGKYFQYSCGNIHMEILAWGLRMSRVIFIQPSIVYNRSIVPLIETKFLHLFFWQALLRVCSMVVQFRSTGALAVAAVLRLKSVFCR